MLRVEVQPDFPKAPSSLAELYYTKIKIHYSCEVEDSVERSFISATADLIVINIW